jgi:hypothetical protein
MQPCQLDNLSAWLEAEIASLPDASHRRVILEVNANLDSFVKWPQRAVLWWAGCKRIKSHEFPPQLKQAVKQAGLKFRHWSNDPAIYSYRLAGGERPKRSTYDEWSIHHIYDGKFPYPTASRASLHAAKDVSHFTQSAGLVAIHPIADALADEFAVFAWRLRAESFLRFGYDPEAAFAEHHDDCGFARQMNRPGNAGGSRI